MAGPNGSGNFLLLKDRLSNPNGPAKDQLLREHIFNRLRMPDYLNKDQGSLKWMPRLSGDAGLYLQSKLRKERRLTDSRR